MLFGPKNAVGKFSGDQTPVLLLYLFYSSDICTIKYSAMVDTFLPGSNNSGEWVLIKVSFHGGYSYFQNLCLAFPCTKQMCEVKSKWSDSFGV